MKILMLTPYLPYPLVSGGQIRTFNLLKNLSKKHDITLFALIKDDNDKQYIKNIEQFCSKVKVFKRSKKPFTLRNIIKAGFSRFPFVVTRNLVTQTEQALKRELKLHHFDLIHAETFYMMPNIPATKIPIILVEQTIEYLGYLSYARSGKLWPLKPLLHIDIAKIKYWEKYYWQHCDRLIAMSSEDKKFITKECPEIEKVDIVANGVDTDFFNNMVKKLPKDPTILFVGTFEWLPNVQAVTYLVEEVWPYIRELVPHAKLNIVGFRPTKKILAFNDDPSITVNGSVSDIRDAYASAHVLVAPVMWGKGTRYKILEAMATHTPIVATPLAVEGIAGIKNQKHVMLGETAEELGRLTAEVLMHEPLRDSLAKESYTLVSQQYNWEAIAAHLDTIYQEIGA